MEVNMAKRGKEKKSTKRALKAKHFYGAVVFMDGMRGL
jgi:hypothetical protein